MNSKKSGILCAFLAAKAALMCVMMPRTAGASEPVPQPIWATESAKEALNTYAFSGDFFGGVGQPMAWNHCHTAVGGRIELGVRLGSIRQLCFTSGKSGEFGHARKITAPRLGCSLGYSVGVQGYDGRCGLDGDGYIFVGHPQGSISPITSLDIIENRANTSSITGSSGMRKED